jgi:hypothetical protein
MTTTLSTDRVEPRATVTRPWVGPSEKVQGWHRDRLALVYVRQSTPQQVHDHQESTRLQYGLTSRARELGWAEARVVVIDDDLGKSGASAPSYLGASGGRASSGWSPRSASTASGSSWAWRCRGWRGRARTGTSCWSCARCSGR